MGLMLLCYVRSLCRAGSLSAPQKQPQRTAGISSCLNIVLSSSLRSGDCCVLSRPASCCMHAWVHAQASWTKKQGPNHPRPDPHITAYGHKKTVVTPYLSITRICGFLYAYSIEQDLLCLTTLSLGGREFTLWSQGRPNADFLQS